jgi:energy-coupling factor transporter ATP-binding protein EcfA2
MPRVRVAYPSPPMHTYQTVRVENFAQIRDATIEFGDLTVLVGPQGSGKSLVLQLFKLALDAPEILSALHDAGHTVDTADEILDVYFGQGMHHGWREETRVTIGNKPLMPSKLPSRSRRSKAMRGANMFYIPAHRATLLADGWPSPFAKLNADTPAIARLFSQNLFSLFGDPRDTELFPVPRRLKEEYRTAIDDAVFHGGRVQLDKETLRKRLELRFGEARLPFMTWTAGQREFTPLLLGLYHLLPARRTRKVPEIDWVVIEEPEMGLHPRAISVVMLLVLDLLWRGYRVILSTHAPLVLDVVFAIRKMQEHAAKPSLLCKAFGITANKSTKQVMRAALDKSLRTFAMNFDGDSVVARDISGLDPSAADPIEAGWGGLTSFSSNFNAIVAEAVND